MRRREFLAASALPLLSAAPSGEVMTVTGPVDASKLGVTLPHEHLFSMFGAEPAEAAQYDERAVLAAVVPYVQSLKRLGCDCIADATAAWFGRDPRLLRVISQKTGVRVITNTGYYGAANDRYVPQHARSETAEQLAARWTAEWKDGIGGTGIRPGFLKIGVDAAPLSEIDRKLIRAAALCHKATGLTIAVHTGGDAAAASEQIAIVKREGVSPQAWIWVHANGVKDSKPLVDAGNEGAWISLDGIEPASVERHLELVRTLRTRKLLGRVLLSHDGNSFRCCGRPMKPYDSLFTHFVPRLREAGFSSEEIRRLTVDNPVAALTVRKRLV